MQLSFKIPWLILVIGIINSPVAQAISHYQEQRYTSELMKTVIMGKPMMLKSGEYDFLAIYSATNTPLTRGGVILLHDIGAHPDWPQVIHPLRTQLPAHGWATLSLQLPILSDHPNAQEYRDQIDQAKSRIKSGIQFLRDKGIANIVLIGHGLGGNLGLYYLANDKSKDSKIIAFVGIALVNQPQVDSSLAINTLIAKLKLPVLDIYGSLDRRIVLDDAALRLRIAKMSGLTDYRQVELSAADHFFTGLEATLVKRIRTWLDKQVPSQDSNGETFVPDGKNPNNIEPGNTKP